ncbi:hypothetical protein [Emcibacter sp.]|uniref:hypothetical protein n=1 Tax=Emcibacter sp. TaxID=1979954 RepID=UPI003A8F2FDF
MENLITIVGALGIGGVLSSYATMIWTKKQKLDEARQNFKEERYKCIILLMTAYISFDEKAKRYLQKYGYNIETEEDLGDLLTDEYVNSFLFASDEFVLAMKDFMLDHTKEKLMITVLSMRKDLYGIKSKLTTDQLF